MIVYIGMILKRSSTTAIPQALSMFIMEVARGTTGTEAVVDVAIGFTMIAKVAGKSTFEFSDTLDSFIGYYAKTFFLLCLHTSI